MCRGGVSERLTKQEKWWDSPFGNPTNTQFSCGNRVAVYEDDMLRRTVQMESVGVGAAAAERISDLTEP